MKFLPWCITILGLGLSVSTSARLPLVPLADAQPLIAQLRRVTDALTLAGAPLTPAEQAAFDQALRTPTAVETAEQLQKIFDPRCLFAVDINPEMRVKAARGDAAAELDEHGWRVFLVKVHNEAGTTANLRIVSPQAQKLAGSTAAEVPDRWLELDLTDRPPLQKSLGGLPLEYRLVALYSRDSGQREAKFAFDVGAGTQDLGFRGEADVLFKARAARAVTFRIRDEHGQPVTGALLIRDALGRVYPSTAKRLAPDFAFHPQIYRADGETEPLPDGRYTITFTRGPESIPEQREIVVGPNGADVAFQVRRWIDPSLLGWWSGDHHIHAAGCAHYERPTQGVLATDMIRHVLGEDLKVGANLTWGPCFDYQKQFFTGTDDRVSRLPYLLHYDVEVSGFGSHESGHLCLLQLEEQMYPGGTSKNHWPKLGLNTLRWAKRQGALVGPAHSGWGLELDSTELPNFAVPPYNGIGANEYIVDVTHTVPGPNGELVPAVDFLSTVDTPYPWELNMWYQTLNAGFRTRISGETDFPCIYGERVGLGRSYVKLDGPLDYKAWCEGIRAGRNYVSDGWSHLPDFRVEDTAMGVNGSELRLDRPRKVKVHVRVAARLDEKAQPEIKRRKFTEHPYWHIERARIDDSREVPVDLIQNGFPVASRRITADGSWTEVEFEVEVTRSSWLAVRILPSAHTNPIFVTVGNKPIRPSRRSVQWCLDGVDQAWRNKEKFYVGAEHEQAITAYQHAREIYRSRLAECEAN